jgi:hypothetical protein
MKDFCEYRAAVDITVACRYRELDQMFPNSLFIYTERAAHGWLRSVSEHYRALGDDLKLPDGEKQFALEADIRIYGTVRPISCDFLDAYRRHHHSVTEYFQGRQRELLRLNIERKDGWKSLCSFLELPVPDVPFPHRGASAGWSQRQEA